MGIEELEPIRDEIDRIDEELLRLLNERVDQVLEIGLVKRRLGLPTYTPEREEEVLRLVQQANDGKLSSAAVRRLFERIIDESRRLERETNSGEDQSAEE
jgi:chorismate mutase